MSAQNPQGANSPSHRTLPYQMGRYILFDWIGRGGMADIYLARATTELGASRLVVIKEVAPQLASQARFAALLTAEAKLAAQMNHSNIVAVEDLGRHDDVLFIAMENVEGMDLRQLLRQCTTRKIALPLRFSLLVVREVLRALDYAHRFACDDGSVGIVHRDVSPSNVLLSFDGEVKLCDFGIASAVSAAGGESATIEGKAGYMSPEHARGDAVDARSDLFAAGVVLWELIAGKRLYKAGEGETLIDVAMRAEVLALPERDLPHFDGLRAVVMKALEREPDQRYDSAREMLDALEEHCIRAKLLSTPIRLGSWLSEHFAEDCLERRRARERAVQALALLGPPVVLEQLPSSDAPPPRHSDELLSTPPSEPAPREESRAPRDVTARGGTSRRVEAFIHRWAWVILALCLAWWLTR